MGDSYSWIAAESGAWSAASNWFDITTATAATAAPGTADTATIDLLGTDAITVTAPADILHLTVDGEVTLASELSVGALTLVHAHLPPRPDAFVEHTATIVVAGSVIANSVTIGSLLVKPGLHLRWVDDGIVDVGAGAMLSAGTVALTAGDLRAAGGAVTISQMLTLGAEIVGVPGGPDLLESAGSLDVSDHGNVHVGGLRLVDGSVSLDATSIVEIGNAGTAAAGTITIDPGAQLALGGLFATRTATAITTIAAPILNNGNIGGDLDLTDVINNGAIDMRIGALGNVINNGIIDIQFGTLSSATNNGSIDLLFGGTLDSVVNNGSIEVGTGTVTAVSGGGVLGFSNFLTVGPSVSATINFPSSPAAPGTVEVALGAGTAIDPSDTPPIAGFAPRDAIILNNVVADFAHYAPTRSGIGTLTLDHGGTSVASLTLLGNYQGADFAVADSADGAAVSVNVTCFAAGTRISTSRGDVSGEHLRAGDAVATRIGSAFRAVRWLGFRTMDVARHPHWTDWAPVRIAKDAFGAGLPRRTLYLSPDHAVFADGMLIPIKYLVNGGTVKETRRLSITYWHVELDVHDVVLAEGLPAESYLDTGDRSNFANGGVVAKLHPSFAALTWEAHGCAPLAVTGPIVTKLRRRLRRRAIALRGRTRRLAA